MEDIEYEYNPKDFYSDLELERVKALDIIGALFELKKECTIEEIFKYMKIVVSPIEKMITKGDIENIVKLAHHRALVSRIERKYPGGWTESWILNIHGHSLT
jgi:hypothetical protein